MVTSQPKHQTPHGRTISIESPFRRMKTEHPLHPFISRSVLTLNDCCCCPSSMVCAFNFCVSTAIMVGPRTGPSGRAVRTQRAGAASRAGALRGHGDRRPSHAQCAGPTIWRKLWGHGISGYVVIPMWAAQGREVKTKRETTTGFY